MVLTRTDENELLTALYGGVAEAEPWRLFAWRLLARTEADLCHVCLRPSAGISWQSVAQALDRGAPSDLLAPAPPREPMRPGRVYSGTELGESTLWARHMRVIAGEAGELSLSLFRAQGDFSASDSALLASLAPHLVIALRTWSQLERERARATLTGQELAVFGGGWLLLDAQARLLDCDGESAALVARGRIMGRAADGRLRLLLPEAEALLGGMIAETGAPEPRAGWLWHDPPMQMLVMPLPERPGWLFAMARYLIRVRSLARPAPSRAHILSDLYRLTPSEAKFAARMAGGASIAEAAKALDLTVETARNYSKRVYGKTGAHGQADLVRLLLDGVGGALPGREGDPL